MTTLKTIPNILIVDDNRDLLHFLEHLIAEGGEFTVSVAESAKEATKMVSRRVPQAVLIDYMLPDGNGARLGASFRRSMPSAPIILMSGSILTPEDEAICEESGFSVLRKPFLATTLISHIRSRLNSISRPLGPPTIPKPSKSGSPVVLGSKALKVFFCYSHRDEKLRDRLDAHLSALRHMSLIQSWHDRKIPAGAEWEITIDRYLTSADLILLLISPDFLNSEYCYRKEMKLALERHERAEAIVIPVILRPVDWESTPFSKLQAVPTDGKPITQWANRDQAYLAATKSIRNAVERLSSRTHRRSLAGSKSANGSGT